MIEREREREEREREREERESISPALTVEMGTWTGTATIPGGGMATGSGMGTGPPTGGRDMAGEGGWEGGNTFNSASLNLETILISISQKNPYTYVIVQELFHSIV